MTVEGFKRANEIADQLKRIGRALADVNRLNFSGHRDFTVSDPTYGARIDGDIIDPLAKEGCKALIISNLEGKKKQLEAEFEKL